MFGQGFGGFGRMGQIPMNGGQGFGGMQGGGFGGVLNNLRQQFSGAPLPQPMPQAAPQPMAAPQMAGPMPTQAVPPSYSTSNGPMQTGPHPAAMRAMQAAGMAAGGVPRRAPGLGIGPAPRGLIASTTAGRTDRLPMKVPPNSYVIPADVVSGIGQGNTLAGGKIFDAMFKQGPHGTAIGKLPRGKGPPQAPGAFKLADGGAAGEVPIITAGGEFVVSPEQVAELGAGDMERGHQLLDGMVTTIRKQVIDEMKSLPGPKR